MIEKPETDVLNAIIYAVRHAIAQVGVEGLRKTSMFPSNERGAVELKKVA